MNLNDLPQAIHAAAIKALEAYGDVLVDEVRESISEPYPPPSSPGDPPHRRSGELVRSISKTVDETTGQVEVGSNLAYAAYLQHGTDRLEARPFLPDEQAVASDVELIISEVVDGLLGELE